MNASRWEQLKEIFNAAVEKTGDERERYLASACVGDPDLMQEVRALLVCDEKTDDLLSNPVGNLGGGDGSPPLFDTGQMVAGRFRILRLIARGGMGEVYEADDLKLGERVALKTLLPMPSADGGIERLKQEIQAARRVTHPNVCRTFDMEEHGDPAVVLATMELLDGPTLSRHLRTNGPISRHDALPLIRQIVGGLQAAHDAGVVHRDFKTGNVILAEGKEGLRPVITDFGLAQMPGPSGKRPDRRAGTPGFMAPEQIEGGPITPATDVYALGVVIAEMIGVCLSAAAAESPGSVSPEDSLPPSLAEDWKKLGSWRPVIERCLRKDPARRFQSPAEVVAALEKASAPWISRRRVWAVMMIAALLLSAGVWFWAIRSPGLHEPGWILVTALDNRAGEPQLDESVPFLIEREISNFPDIYVVPQSRVDDALALMKSNIKGRVDEKLAREVCQRDSEIRLIAGCRAERIGTALQLTAWVTDASGRMLGSASEQVQTLEETGKTVRILAAGIRRAAGQRNAGSSQEIERLEKVATPSLRAAKAYSLAYREGDRNNWAAAEQWARAALAEDPEFASAHLWLYYALTNQNKAGPEAMVHLEQAVVFSRSATDRERAFILTVQRNQKAPNQEKIINWRKMLASYPDHFWARNNLGVSLRQAGMYEEAALNSYGLADLFPTRMPSIHNALRSAVEQSDLARIKKYRDRLLALMKQNPESVPPNLLFWMSNFDKHLLWISGELEEMSAGLESAAGNSLEQIQLAVSVHQCLGQLNVAKSLITGRFAAGVKPAATLLVDFMRDDEEAVREDLSMIKIPDQYAGVLAVRSDWDARKLREYIEQFRSANAPFVASHYPCIESRFASLHGDLAMAEAKHKECRQFGSVTYFRFMLAAALARAYEKAGDDRHALSTIEEVDLGPMPMERRVAYWHRIRYDRARYLRKLGRVREAEAIEASLRSQLRFADPDHPILVRLNETIRRPLNIY